MFRAQSPATASTMMLHGKKIDQASWKLKAFKLSSRTQEKILMTVHRNRIKSNKYHIFGLFFVLHNLPTRVQICNSPSHLGARISMDRDLQFIYI